MNRSGWALVAFVLGLLLAFPRTVTAAVFERDWKAPGDGLLTYDDVNQREWLDLSQSKLTRFPGATYPERFQSVVSELGPGGTLDGFSVAKSDDLRFLAQSAGIDLSNVDFLANEQPTRNLIDLVGVTASGINGQYSLGFVDELAAPPRDNLRVIGHLRVNPADGSSGSVGLRFYDSVEPFQAPGLGVWLYRSTVPEPSSLAIVICLNGMVWRQGDCTKNA